MGHQSPDLKISHPMSSAEKIFNKIGTVFMVLTHSWVFKRPIIGLNFGMCISVNVSWMTSQDEKQESNG